MNAADATLRLDVEGMNCAGCATKIEGALRRVKDRYGKYLVDPFFTSLTRYSY